MRMRRKKNLEEKLLECSDILLSPVTDDRNYNTAVDKKEYFDYKELFGNDNRVELEIGCGKGQFICEKAKLNPDINFLAVELNANVIMLACKKAKSMGVTNVKFVKCRAEYLPKYITPNSIERIYLNFSCPFPKKKYASHRLTNRSSPPARRFIKKQTTCISSNTR